MPTDNAPSSPNVNQYEADKYSYDIHGARNPSELSHDTAHVPATANNGTEQTVEPHAVNVLPPQERHTPETCIQLIEAYGDRIVAYRSDALAA